MTDQEAVGGDPDSSTPNDTASDTADDYAHDTPEVGESSQDHTADVTGAGTDTDAVNSGTTAASPSDFVTGEPKSVDAVTSERSDASTQPISTDPSDTTAQSDAPTGEQTKTSPDASSFNGSSVGGSPAEGSSSVTSAPPPVDDCPDHDTQLIAGSCGCGHEPDRKCQALRDSLSHRYSFGASASNAAASILDSVGSADGTIHDSEFDWDGSLLMDGQESYVELPAGLLSKHDEGTLDLWVKWWGGSDNQRLLNFGLAPDGSDDAPDNYLSVSPSGSNGVITVQYRTNEDERGDKLEAEHALQTSDLQHITLVIRQESLSLFVNGESMATVDTVHHLGDLNDDHNWLGRALYSGYPLYKGAFFEFRVFERALSDDEVQKLDEVGLSLP